MTCVLFSRRRATLPDRGNRAALGSAPSVWATLAPPCSSALCPPLPLLALLALPSASDTKSDPSGSPPLRWSEYGVVNALVLSCCEAAYVVEEEFVEQFFRIGEASNPGPYSVGGASSLASLPPPGPVVSRSAEGLDGFGLPEIGVAAAHVIVDAVLEAPPRVPSNGHGVSSFDDADD